MARHVASIVRDSPCPPPSHRPWNMSERVLALLLSFWHYLPRPGSVHGWRHKAASWLVVSGANLQMLFRRWSTFMFSFRHTLAPTGLVESLIVGHSVVITHMFDLVIPLPSAHGQQTAKSAQKNRSALGLLLQ